MIRKDKLITLFQQMQKEHWSYEWGAARKGCVDCSGAFVYAYRLLGNLRIAIHGSNYIARQECGEMLPISQAEPGMAAFKKRDPGNAKYALPGRYKRGGAYYNGDLADYYHIGLVSSDVRYVLNAQSTKTGFVRSPITQNWAGVAKLTKVTEEDEPMLYQAIVANLKEGTSTVNIRETASTSAKKLGKAKAGDAVDVYENDGTWSKVVYGSIEGYIMSQFLQKVEEGSTTTTTSAAENAVEAAEETVVETTATSSQLKTLLQENNAQLATLNTLLAEVIAAINTLASDDRPEETAAIADENNKEEE